MGWEEDFAEGFMYVGSKNLDENSKGHTWRRDDMTYPDGYVPADMFALSEGYCNGPECESCGYSFYMHCTSVKRIQKCTRPVPGLAEKLAEVQQMKEAAR